ncbi:hypothetical protein BLNAU_3755 [Blattamonas nauphoetae]|uniref:Uncharacterized protein n=1 Tax=Blattamonas nauphoetae TaxID=2049346 RepID=A0ABQ9YCH9_9EUKA|nr:hypothetical protein BLNAU_3755 [Blattamonas nauphoetae]
MEETQASHYRTISTARDLFTQHYINFFTLFGDESHLIGTSSSLDTQFEYDGSVPTIRVVSNPAVDFRFIDANGDLRSVYFDQQRPFWEVEADVFLKRTIQRAVDARIILRFVDGQEEDSKMDGVDCEWADKSDIGSDEENSAEDGDEDAHNEEETEEGDRDSYDPDLDIKSEHSLDSIGHIQHLFAEQASNSDTDDALSSDQREIVQNAHPQRRRNVVSRYNRNYNTSLTPKYPVQPLFTTVSLRLVKVRTICTVRRDERNEFLTLVDFLLDVQVKKMRKTGLTQFESTCVESVEVVADVEVRIASDPLRREEPGESLLRLTLHSTDDVGEKASEALLSIALSEIEIESKDDIPTRMKAKCDSYETVRLSLLKLVEKAPAATPNPKENKERTKEDDVQVPCSTGRKEVRHYYPHTRANHITRLAPSPLHHPPKQARQLQTIRIAKLADFRSTFE